jgi:hypothetical protein
MTRVCGIDIHGITVQCPTAATPVTTVVTMTTQDQTEQLVLLAALVSQSMLWFIL